MDQRPSKSLGAGTPAADLGEKLSEDPALLPGADGRSDDVDVAAPDVRKFARDDATGPEDECVLRRGALLGKNLVGAMRENDQLYRFRAHLAQRPSQIEKTVKALCNLGVEVSV